MPLRLRLNEIIKERGISQRELARLTGLRPNTISHLCSDKVNSAYFETLEVICRALDIDIKDLMVLKD